MNAGDLDRRITILRPEIVIDDVGDEQETWLPAETCWASKREIGAREILRNPAIKAELDAVFTIRHPGRSIDTTMRLQEGDRLYAITGISELPGRRVGYEIVAKGLDPTAATTA